MKLRERARIITNCNVVINWEDRDQIHSQGSDKVRCPSVKGRQTFQGEVPQGQVQSTDHLLVDLWNRFSLSRNMV